MASNVAQFPLASVRILILCPDHTVGRPVADALRRSGATVNLAEDPDTALCEIDELQPEVVWAIATGDDTLRVAQFCRLVEVVDITHPINWTLFWVGRDVPEGLSVIAGSFEDIPRLDEILRLSRASSP